MSPKPIIVISATRFFQGGTLVVVNECLKYLSAHYSKDYTIKALVFKQELYEEIPGIDWVQFPRARKSIIYRLYDEYIGFNRLSRKWKPVLWLSLQDSTPTVQAKVRVVYYHNPLLLKPKSLNLWRHQPRLEVLRLLYKYIYTSGIQRNNFVITQQEAVAAFLTANYQLNKQKVWVFPPVSYLLPVNRQAANKNLQKSQAQSGNSPYTFIFPATAFYYKNHALIVEACHLLSAKGLKFKVLLTINGTENSHVRKLVSAAHITLPQIQFLGFLDRTVLFSYYAQADCMLFPSLLESWGLPLTEFAALGKPILCADLPYSRASLSSYDFVAYFDPTSAAALAALMLQAIEKRLDFPPKNGMKKEEFPQMATWADCFNVLLAENEAKT